MLNIFKVIPAIYKMKSNDKIRFEQVRKHFPPVKVKDISIKKDVMIKMRDGITLSSNLYQPEGCADLPLILVRTPYGKDYRQEYDVLGRLICHQGYNVLIQDTRGRYKSEGTFYPFKYEKDDGEDTIEWISQCKWFNGKIGTFGESYVGYTQWAVAQNQHIKTLVPMVTGTSMYSILYENGVLNLHLALLYAQYIMGRKNHDLWLAAGKKYFSDMPLEHADVKMRKKSQAFRDWVRYYDDSHPYWKQVDFSDTLKTLDKPALFIEGWYDIFISQAFDDFQQLTSNGGRLSKDSAMIIGPWDHIGNHIFKDYIYTDKASYSGTVYKRIIDWYDYWLKGVENSTIELLEKPIHMFMSGGNKWCAFNEMPKGVRKTFWMGNRKLDAHKSQNQAISTYTYNPAEPSSFKGGKRLFEEAGPSNVAHLLNRETMAWFCTDKLQEALTICGRPEVELYASVNAKDIDFIIKLCEIIDEHKWLLLSEGALRARYRNGVQTSSPLIPGIQYRLVFSLNPIFHRLQKGNKLGIVIASSDFPRYNRNFNTYNTFGEGGPMKKVEIKIYPDSNIKLNVV